MNALTRWNPMRSDWNPLRELAEAESRLEQIFGRSGRGGDDGKEFTMMQWAPAVDITEDEQEYLIHAELPEMKKDDVKVTVENGELCISGERKIENEDKNKKYHRRERAYGSFMRSFTLPPGVSGNDIKADFKSGILNIHLPKDKEAAPRTVEIDIQ